jgi:hypothetical protein
MSTLGSIVFDAAYSIADIRAALRCDNRKTTVARCIVASIGGSRVATDEGVGITPDVSLRMASTDYPSRGCAMGDIVEVSIDGATWKAYRVEDPPHTSAGMTRLTLGNTNAR